MSRTLLIAELTVARPQPHELVLRATVSNVSRVYRMSDEQLQASLDAALYATLGKGIPQWDPRTGLVNWELEPDE